MTTNSPNEAGGTPIVVNPLDPQNPILSINMNNITKLNSNNYVTWQLQVSLFLDGHDFSQYINPDYEIPSPTVTVADNTQVNPKYPTWIRQDKLILMALMGSLTTSLQPLVARVTTTLEAWTLLSSTFGRPSRGHLKQIKEQLKKTSKGSLTIDEYLQLMKTKSDQLALLGKPLDHEDLLEYILEGLTDDYRGIVEQINGRDVPPSLDELRDKLVNREAALLYSQPSASSFPITANYGAPG